MFEEEIKMEEKSSNVTPLLMVLALAAALIGGIGYFAVEHTRKVSDEQARAATTALLEARGPEKVHFHVGFVTPTMGEKPYDPHYRLLENVGVVKLGKLSHKGRDVQLTPAGEELLRASGASEDKNPDGTRAFTVPLGYRKLVRVAQVEMLNPVQARVDYEWKWEPTPLGLRFDMNSAEMKSMETWETVVLIEHYGTTAYLDPKPKRGAALLNYDRKAKEWKP